VGSRNGWKEASYVKAPCTAADLGLNLLWLGEQMAIVPGVALLGGREPDVMRGEEVQMVGAADLLGLQQAVMVLPGTHSKWALWQHGQLASFSTHMTGEIYALLRQHSILGKLMQPNATPGAADPFDPAAFRQGVMRAQRGDLLHSLFGVRSLALFNQLKPAALPSYLSGLLIGEEFRAALAAMGVDTANLAANRAKNTQASAASASPQTLMQVVLVGNPALTLRYAHAAKALGLQTLAAPAHSTWRGIWCVAQAAGLVA
jgi:2-dehydro-3-deoxygalactonokinase